MLDPKIKEIILEVASCRAVTSYQLVQELWSGYGQLIRCWTDSVDHASIIVKHVEFNKQAQHPRGWTTEQSHQRKLRSYVIENQWYSNYSNSTNGISRQPQLLYSSITEEALILILEDLDGSGFDVRKDHASIDDMHSCLNWLADFHARHLGFKTDGLWPVGTYWHLATRPDELRAMSNRTLQRAAPEIDKMLNQAQFQTIVHGDAKLANFCFSNKVKRVAAVDFQYVGGGCGIKDVAYFISSCLEEQDCIKYEKSLLDYYFDQLALSLTRYGKESVVADLITEWRSLYPFAWADFYRFLDGWSPGHWKMHEYSKSQTDKALEVIQSNQDALY